MKRDELLKIAKPILFNTEMVRAILDGRKTQTRILLYPYPKDAFEFVEFEEVTPFAHNALFECSKTPETRCVEWLESVRLRHWKDDILYVQETWAAYSRTEGILPKIIYRADGEEPKGVKWKPSIHMPKEAARIFLRVTNVSVAKLQDIPFDDYIKEGVYVRPEAYNDPDNAFFQAQRSFAYLWNTTIPKKDLDEYGWEANPWVEVYMFERIEVADE